MAIFELLRRLDLERRAAICTTLLYVASPTSVLFEKWLMYTQIETGALLLAGGLYA